MLGPGAASVASSQAHGRGSRAAQRLSLLIATGIGLHNFGEGLAIGQSAAQDLTSLALVLIIGFGLHNATEGFGIVGPLSARPSGRAGASSALMGLIGGGPTFVGTVIGQAWVSETLDPLLRARRRLDPLRRDRAAQRLPDVRLEVADRLGHPARAAARLRHRLRARRRRRLASGLRSGACPATRPSTRS